MSDDIRYEVQPDPDNSENILIGVVSTSRDASCWVRCTDQPIKEGGTKFIMDTLKAMKRSLIYQHANGLLVVPK